MRKYSFNVLLCSFFLLAFGACSTSKHAQSNVRTAGNNQNPAYIAYIYEFSSLAVEQMNKYDIPASITLAQALLESGAGRSTLARKSNNHFGIKATSDWKGKKVTAPDWGGNFYFRAYRTPEESYEDHSRFLKRHPRYAGLFKLKKTDYEGWAYGLKKAGYAEDPQYPNSLIRLIDTYELMRFDSGKREKADAHPVTNASFNHEICRGNELYYIRVKPGDTFKSLSKELELSERKLRKYNDLYKGYVLRPGDILYLQRKNRKALKPYKEHRLSAGESLYSVSQKYGIRLDRLYKMNDWEYNRRPQAGEWIKLR